MWYPGALVSPAGPPSLPAHRLSILGLSLVSVMGQAGPAIALMSALMHHQQALQLQGQMDWLWECAEVGGMLASCTLSCAGGVRPHLDLVDVLHDLGILGLQDVEAWALVQGHIFQGSCQGVRSGLPERWHLADGIGHHLLQLLHHTGQM